MTSTASNAPIVVGGLGGSGTRLVAAILRAGGVWLGARVNDTDDALAFRQFNQTWIVPCLEHSRGAAAAPDSARMADDLRAAVREHSADRQDASQPWGWKRPESLYVLPLLDQQLPGMKFIHVIRDGRDMAFSSNQNDLPRYELALFGRRHFHEPEALRSLRLWARANTATADHGESRMGARYVRVQYEALCAQPRETVAALFDRLGLEAEASRAAALVSDPGGGRWRSQGGARLRLRLLRADEPALKRFGYWDGGDLEASARHAGPLGEAWMRLEELVWRSRYVVARGLRAAREGRLLAALGNALTRRTR